jgi:hypothetical protein
VLLSGVCISNYPVHRSLHFNWRINGPVFVRHHAIIQTKVQEGVANANVQVSNSDPELLKMKSLLAKSERQVNTMAGLV